MGKKAIERHIYGLWKKDRDTYDVYSRISKRFGEEHEKTKAAWEKHKEAHQTYLKESGDKF